MSDEDQRTIYCSNLSEKVDEELIYELFLQVSAAENVEFHRLIRHFLQAGPIERVSMPKDSNGDYRGIAFVEYSHQASVPYALQLFMGSKLHSRPLNMRSRNNTNPVPLTPQYIEANNPLTAPGHSSRYNNGHMQPHGRGGYGRPPPVAGGNPFEQFSDPSLLMALTANFQAHGGGNAYQDLGRYEHRDGGGGGGGYRDEDRGHNKHRGNSYRSHEQYNPYKHDDRRDGGGGGGHRDRERDRGGRDWTNGSKSQSNNRRRF